MKIPFTRSIVAAACILAFSPIASEANTLCAKTSVRSSNLSAFAKNFKVVPTGRACPRGFTRVGPAGGLQGPTGPAGQTGESGYVNITSLSSNFSTSLNSISSGTFTASTMFQLGSFSTAVTKSSATSALKVAVSSFGVLANNGTSTGFCTYQVRLNGVSANGTTGSTFSFTSPGNVTIGSNNLVASERIVAPLNPTAVFTGLDAGSYTVSLWVRGAFVTDCAVNEGVFTNHAIVEEIELPTAGIS